jgi:purine-nucleoside phosphorylase
MVDLFQKTIQFLKENGISNAQTGIVLGTGLSDLLKHVDIVRTIPYSDIPAFPISTVEFHKGNLILAELGSQKLLIMQGRFHFYEGYTMQQVVFPIRIMKMLGVERLLLSNAAGGISPDFRKGDLVLIDDHINLQTANPLIGKNIDSLGDRFPDMSRPYNEQLSNLLLNVSIELNNKLKKGVYAAVNGPNLETRAEYRYLKIIGADMVGMSTVPEVIAANHMKLPCAAISVITDECDPDNLKPISIEEIIQIAGIADKKLSVILLHTLKQIEKTQTAKI